MGPSPRTRMRTEGASTGGELVIGVVTLVLSLATISSLGPSPPGGPRPTVPYAGALPGTMTGAPSASVTWTRPRWS
jgi:hypothetical protein